MNGKQHKVVDVTKEGNVTLSDLHSMIEDAVKQSRDPNLAQSEKEAIRFEAIVKINFNVLTALCRLNNGLAKVNKNMIEIHHDKQNQ